MPKTTLQAIQNSSPNSILSAAAALKSVAFPRRSWLDSNRYLGNIIDIISKEGNAAPSNPPDLAQYIAASTFLHCFDGWNFFSCSIDELIDGNVPNAIFMAYYAQIRAFMSLFATEGIGIFKNKHFYFDTSGKCESFPGSTHDVIPNLINDWANDPRRSYRFLEILNYEGINLLDWISGADVQLGSPLIPLLGKNWLDAWSLDLIMLGKDHNLRNEASYRPHQISKNFTKPMVRNDLQLCLDTWKLCEPIGSNHFSLLDKFLLRETLRTIYKARSIRRIDLQAFIQTTMINHGLSINSPLYNFLISDPVTEKSKVLKYAKESAVRNGYVINAIPVICRAFILLRIASAAVENFSIKCGVSRSDVRFWWKDLGEKSGLWSIGNQPNQMSDLWADVEQVILNLEQYLESEKGKLQLMRLKQSHAFDLWQIGQFTKAGLWAFGL